MVSRNMHLQAYFTWSALKTALEEGTSSSRHECRIGGLSRKKILGEPMCGIKLYEYPPSGVRRLKAELATKEAELATKEEENERLSGEVKRLGNLCQYYMDFYNAHNNSKSFDV